ncbi:Uncharacterized protein ALO75_05351 [Pseudomonas syringae pv. coryli]|uniref:Uncharacterized protein n=1 Tax=Pseudomonas syringae pv. coryli TaxID=317659 RepID=A0A0P9MHG1_9PSED|nr:Uncharacterized protein ALO75_05351 [Pseudomonas syringae pv. coryli]
MDGAVADGRQRVFEKPGFIERVGVQLHLKVVFVGDFQAGVDHCRHGAPVLVNLQSQAAATQLPEQRFGLAGIAASQKAEVDRPGFGSLQHLADVPLPATIDADRDRPERTADQCGQTCRQRVIAELRGVEMHMHVDTAGGDDQALGIAYGRGDAADQLRVYAVHDLRVAGLANGHDLAVLDTDVAFDDADHRVDDQRVADQHIEGAVSAVMPGHQAHAVTQRLATAVQALIAGHRVVELDFGQQRGVAQAHGIASRGAVHGGVFLARHRCHASGSLEVLGAGTLQRCELAGRIVQVAIGQATEAVDVASSAKLHQLHFAQLAGFEAHRRACGNIQVHAEGTFTREIQRLVDLEKVIVTADLHRPVAGIDRAQGGGRAVAIEVDIAVR